MFFTRMLGNVDECRTECEVYDETAATVAVVHEGYDGWHVNLLREVSDEERKDFDAIIQTAKQSLSCYVNRMGENPPDGTTAAALSLWLLLKDDGTARELQQNGDRNAT